MGEQVGKSAREISDGRRKTALTRGPACRRHVERERKRGVRLGPAISAQAKEGGRGEGGWLLAQAGKRGAELGWAGWPGLARWLLFFFFFFFF